MKISIKLIALMLSIVVLMQSCRVYHSATVSVDEAISSQKRVKVKSNDNETYRIKKLDKNNGKLYGVAHLNSDAAHYLSSYLIDNTNGGKYVDILIPDKFISKIQLHNKSLSTVLTVLLPIIAIGGLLTIAVANMSLNLGWGGGI